MEGELFDINLDTLGEEAVLSDNEIEIVEPTPIEPEGSSKDKNNKKLEVKQDLINLDEAVSEEDEGEEDAVNTNKDTSASANHLSPTAEYADAFASDMVEEGIFQNFDLEAFKKITDPAEKAKAIIEGGRGIAVSAIESFIDSLEPGMKNIMLNYVAGVPLKDIIAYNDNMLKWSSITEDKLKEDARLRKEVIKQDLINRRYAPEKADKLAQRSIDLGEDIDDALEAFSNITAFEKAKLDNIKEQERLRQEEFETSKAKQIESIKGAINSTEEIIPGIKLNEDTKSKIFKSITTIVGQDSEGRPYNAAVKKRAESPVDFDTKLHYYIQLGLFDKNPDFSKLVNVTKTKVTSKLAETIAREPQFKAGKTFNSDIDSNRVAKKILDMF